MMLCWKSMSTGQALDENKNEARRKYADVTRFLHSDWRIRDTGDVYVERKSFYFEVRWVLGNELSCLVTIQAMEIGSRIWCHLEFEDPPTMVPLDVHILLTPRRTSKTSDSFDEKREIESALYLLIIDSQEWISRQLLLPENIRRILCSGSRN